MLILSTLDYCNALLLCLPDYKIQLLQKVMNKAVRFILNLRYREHIRPFLHQLHFLPVKFRIKFKACLIAFKMVNRVSPQYLTEKVELFTPNPMLNLRPGVGRDEKTIIVSLKQQKKNTIYTKIILEWNNLPQKIRLNTDLAKFKSELKTHFFEAAFMDLL